MFYEVPKLFPYIYRIYLLNKIIDYINQNFILLVIPLRVTNTGRLSL